jgi:uncharacterized protein (TIGR03083 family)
MATRLTLEQHTAALRRALDRMAESVVEAGPEATVPSCPGWTVRDLVAHIGMVHRWATANLVGDAEMARTPEPIEVEGRTQPDPAAWLRSGGAALLEAIDAADDDLDALVFLKDAPPPRQFWTRRQCHETTIHGVDALGARLGRLPTTAEADVPLDIAVDGIDELLTGFVPRRRERVRSATPYSLGVRPDDAPSTWLLEVSEDPVVTSRHSGPGAPRTDRVLTGPAAGLYLALWNRGDDVVDETSVLAEWREQMRVAW